MDEKQAKDSVERQIDLLRYQVKVACAVQDKPLARSPRPKAYRSNRKFT